MAWADRAAQAYKVHGLRTAIGYESLAIALLARRQYADAAAATAKAVSDAAGTTEEPVALLHHAWALSAAGRRVDADAAIAALTSKADPLAQARDRRVANFARGLALFARARLPPRSNLWRMPRRHYRRAHPESVEISTCRSGRRSARRCLRQDGQPMRGSGSRRLPGSGDERAREPIDFVRSFYFLGRIYEQQGDKVESQAAYRRFVGYWKGGDLDRDRITEAQRKIGS